MQCTLSLEGRKAASGLATLDRAGGCELLQKSMPLSIIFSYQQEVHKGSILNKDSTWQLKDCRRGCLQRTTAIAVSKQAAPYCCWMLRAQLQGTLSAYCL